MTKLNLEMDLEKIQKSVRILTNLILSRAEGPFTSAEVTPDTLSHIDTASFELSRFDRNLLGQLAKTLSPAYIDVDCNLYGFKTKALSCLTQVSRDDIDCGRRILATYATIKEYQDKAKDFRRVRDFCNILDGEQK